MSVSADAVHDVPVQLTLSLLESFTFGAVHELRVEHLAGTEQHVSVSADTEHDVPAQLALSLLESFTFGAVHELRVEHLAGTE
eukprot:COSAG01_NODE_508_length_16107_cov_120.001187_1_plen_82_part_10